MHAYDYVQTPARCGNQRYCLCYGLQEALVVPKSAQLNVKPSLLLRSGNLAGFQRRPQEVGRKCTGARYESVAGRRKGMCSACVRLLCIGYLVPCIIANALKRSKIIENGQISIKENAFVNAIDGF